MSNRTSIKYPGAIASISKVHINNMYIKYTFTLPSFLFAKYLADKKDGKVNKSIYDIHVIDVYFTSVHSNPWVFDTGPVARISNSKQEVQNEQRLVKGKVMMCVGSDSKVDNITIAHSLYLRD